MMAQATCNRPSSGKGRRTYSLLIGLLALTALVVLMTTQGTAQVSTKETPPKGTPKAEETYKHVIASPDTTVKDMVKVINDKIEAKWKENKIKPARFADDYEYIRRASLDIIGRIAKPDEIAAYLKDPKETRRSLLIERLLASDEYPIHFASLWTNWLLTRSGIFGRGMYHDQMADWLKDQFAQNVPFNKLVKDLVTATGKNSENGAVNFILAHLGENVPAAKRFEEGSFEMVPITSRMTRVFLGTQVQCAQCHDHPFHNNIKQKHFWGINAYFRQAERVGNIPMRRQDGLMTLELKDNPNVNVQAKVFYEKRNGVVLQQKAEFLPKGDDERGIRLDPQVTGKGRREELASALIDHPNFPRALVNRYWGTFLGRGFVNPIDDFNDNNQPSNPELLNELSNSIKHYNYDLKKLIRWIANSNAYHLSYVANETNDKPEQEALFSRMVLKSLTPEQMFESLMVATHEGGAAKAEEKKDLRNKWLDSLVSNFGDDEGNEVNFNGTIVQALLMMNGEDLNKAVTNKDGTVANIMKRQKAGPGIVTDLYLATLNRKPSPKELNLFAEKRVMRIPDKEAAAQYQDLFWALLNSNEFLLNH
jgi:hypothetical protein